MKSKVKKASQDRYHMYLFLTKKRPFPYLDYYAFFHSVVISSNFAVQIPKGNKTQKYKNNFP